MKIIKFAIFLVLSVIIAMSFGGCNGSVSKKERINKKVQRIEKQKRVKENQDAQFADETRNSQVDEIHEPEFNDTTDIN